MNKGLSNQRENTSVALSITALCLLSLNFVKSHSLAEPFELRFLVSGIIFGMISLFSRFGLVIVTPLHRSLYRIAVVMMFWSICFFFLPFSNMVLYLIPLPGFYFLFRIETKKIKVTEDILATGILLALGTFLYAQQRPLQMILFPDQPFDWINYYIHSPVIIIMGIGFLRLRKHSGWKGLSLVGTILISIGVVLATSYLLKPFWPYFTEILCVIVFLHLLQIYFNIPHSGQVFFVRFTGIPREDFKYLGIILYIIGALIIHVCIVQLLYFYGHDLRALVTVILGLGALLYLYRQFMFSLVMVEMAALFFSAGVYFFIGFGLFWSIPIAAMILISVISRRKKHFYYPVNNTVIRILLLFYYALIFQFNLLNPSGIAFIFFPFLCWIFLPDRPLSIPRAYHFAFWPVISFIVLICLFGGFSHGFLIAWALINIFIPLGIFIIIRIKIVKSFAVRAKLHFINDWLENSQQALFVLAYVSAGISIVNVTLNFKIYSISWAPVFQTGLVFIAGAGIFLGYALTNKKIGFVIRAEFFFWAILALVRWKLDMQESLEFGSPADGYFLIVISIMIAGAREILRKKIPEFSEYFQKTILLYSIIGWLYLQTLQIVLNNNLGGTFHHAELSSMLMAALTLWLSRTQKSTYVIYTFVFLNAAVLLYFFSLDCTNLMFYIFPSMGSVLVLTQIFKDKLGVNNAKHIRLIASLIICGTSAFYNIMDFDSSIWFPVAAALVSTLLVISGISFRIRIFFYLGTLFFIVNAIGVISHIIINQPPENITLFVGVLFLVTGIFFTASFLAFQMKRQQIIDRYNQLTGKLKTWD